MLPSAAVCTGPTPAARGGRKVTGVVRAIVEAPGGRLIELDHMETLTFGRAQTCSICLDPDDTGISRIAGVIGYTDNNWWVSNRSSTRPLSLADDLGFRSVLGPQRIAAILTQTTIIVSGARGDHSIGVSVEVPRLAEQGEVREPSGVPTATGAEVMINSADRLAMVALFSGYLEDPPRYDPHPKKYAA